MDQLRRGEAQMELSARAIENDGGATSEQESSSSRLISVEDSVDIVGGGPRTGTAPTRVIDTPLRGPASPWMALWRRLPGYRQLIISDTGQVGTRYPSATSYDYPACTSSSGRCSSPDNIPSASRTKEHPFRHPSRSRFSDRCDHEVAKGA